MLWSFEPVKYCRRCTKRFRRHDAQVDLQAASEADRHFRVAAADHRGQLFESAELVHRVLRVVGVDQEIDVANGFAAAAVAAGDLHLANAVHLAHVGEQFLHDFVGVRPVHPLMRTGGQVDAGENFLLCFLAEAFESLHLVGFAGGLQGVERRDAEAP